MKRILVVSTSYPAHHDDPAGHFVRADALELAREGARVTVLAPRPMREDIAGAGGSFDAHAVGGDELFAWPGAIARAREKPLRLAHLARAGLATARAIQRLGPFDRAVLHFVVPVGFPLALSLDAPEIDVVAHGADVRLLDGAPRLVRERVLASLLDRGTRFRFVARHLLDRLAVGIGRQLAARLEAASFVAPLPFDLPARTSLAPPERPARFARYAVWVGRDVPTKRLDLAREAAAHAEVPLVAVGVNGASRAGYGVPARDERSATLFTGPLPRDQALAWIAHASLLLSTSSEEGAPTTVREARALGVRVVACPAGDLEAWAARDTAIAIAEPSIGALAAALQSAMDAPGARADQSP